MRPSRAPPSEISVPRGKFFFCVASLSLAVVVPRILNFGADILYLLFHTTIIPQQLLDPVLFTCIQRIPHIIRQQAVN